MTKLRTPRLPVAVLIFLAIFTLTPLAALAQQSSAGQSLADPSKVDIVHGTGALSQAGQRIAATGTSASEILLQGPRKKKRAYKEDSGSVSLLPAVGYGSSSTYGQSVVVADVNHDGNPDLVVTAWLCYGCGGSTQDGMVSVLLGNGDGTFQPAVVYDSGGQYAQGVAVADVNGDGKLDLIVANAGGESNGDGPLAVLLGNGDGTFQPAVTYDPGAYGADSVAVADLNGDGKPDLVVGNSCGVICNSAVTVLLGNGDGTFQSAVHYGSVVGGAAAVAIADVNGDGKPDVLVAYSWSCTCETGSTGVLLGNGDGTLRPGPIHPGAGGGSVAVADVNMDGKVDLIVTAACGNSASCGNSTVGVLLGNGDGSFQNQVTYYAGGYQASSVAVADINGDGVPDLVVANGCLVGGSGCNDGPVGVLLGNGDGTFQQVIEFESGGAPQLSVAAADVNGDGKPDVIVLNSFGAGSSNMGSTAGVLLNNTGSPHVSTSTALTSSLNPSVYGQTVTLSATVTCSAGTPIGMVAFYNGSTPLGNGALAGGKTSLSISSVSAGSDSITATYFGSGSFAPSVSTPLAQKVSPATTTISLYSSASSAVIGQSVTYSAYLNTEYGTSPTGTVTFRSGSQTLGVASVNSYSASFTTSFATIGTYLITAQYNGDSNDMGSTSNTVTQIILLPTGTSLFAGPNPAFIGEAVTFTAQVTSSYGTPTGTVYFSGHRTHPFGNWAVLCGSTLAGRVGSCTVSSLAHGDYEIQANYSGSSTFIGSSSSYSTERSINRYPTSTSVTSSVNPSLYGQRVTFTATVTSLSGVIPDGEVSFYDGDKIGTSATSGGVATFTTSTLKSGTHTIRATFAGPGFEPSSGTVTQVVTPLSTTTTLTSSLNPSTYGQPITWTATVTSAGSHGPTGKVKFAGIGVATLNGSGVATFTKTWLNAATYAITAEYEGDEASAPSDSAALNQVVNPATTTTVVTSPANPSTQGESVTFTATVKTSTSVNPAGTVTFTAGGTTLGTATLSGNVASISTSSLPVGAYAVQATYNGETDFTGSSGRVTQTVNQ